jgi:hypothetical protein
MPAPIAMVVITIGRALVAGVEQRFHPRYALVAPGHDGVLHEQDGVLDCNPISAIRPIIEGMEIAVWVAKRARNAPEIDSTRAARIVTDCTKSLNSSTMAM